MLSRDEFRMPVWAANWKIFLLFAVVAFSLAFGLRCIDLPKWVDPQFSVNGEYILGTHDAYFWLAGAKGIGSAVGNPMCDMISWLGSITGAQYGNIAFWLPAVFAGFCAIAAFAWGMLVGGPWVGIAAAFFATSVPAYYFRTRLSYYDTDVVTLFFPLLISVLQARWVSLGSRGSWLPESKKDISVFQPSVWEYLLPVIAGVVTYYGQFWHRDVLTFGIMTAAISFGLIIVCGRKESRAVLLRGMLLFAFCAFMGWIGVFLSAGAIFFFLKRAEWQNKFYDNIFILAALFLGIFFISGSGQNLLWQLSIKFSAYMKPVADGVATSHGPQYPGIAQSVIEAQNISLDVLFTNLTGSAFLAWCGFGAFAVAMVFRPALVYLLPFGIITFAAVTMGGRFSMFGGIVPGIGLSFVAHYLIQKFVKTAKPRLLLDCAQALVVVGLLFTNVYGTYREAPATPIMGPQHVKALVEAGKVMPKDSTVWTWWDWGYATMYYAEADTFANGGHHGGPVLFPLGFAYSTPSYLQSSQLIKFSAVNGNKPYLVWNDMSAAEVENMIRSFGQVKYNYPKAPKQYLVVSWENIRLAYWILYYGGWSVKSGSGVHPTVQQITKRFNLDFENGRITLDREAPIQLSSYDFIGNGQRVFKDFPTVVGPHLLYNQTVQQGYLVDDFMYKSLLVRLLLDNPESPELKNSFSLVYEGFPYVRIFEVL